ncbi:hypothetical protein C7H19_01145 [Aphanothece hegewaldii CCALA 016]|uniref:ADP-ribosylglycohydrolase family protein n=1 Tax=Aphanothece hegewaldii CCALA 016 TaxID=2107694 RepID=A0A2T1M3K5_9CHRO|nr:hypothetical protein [Aphanothece hegewaldii]PSF39424.1 hypothetical protein C7H19_01145 [Aphanothece hegewaldii CCALA 016]
MQFLPVYRWQGGLLGSCVGEWLPQFNTDTQTVIPYLQIGQHLINDFIEKRQLSEQDWLNIYQQYSKELKNCRSGELILSLLPLFLFYHDSRWELEQQLYLVETLWQQPAQTINDVLVWGYLCSLILREELQPQQWLDDLIQVAHSRQTSLKELLELVKRLLDDAVPLHQGIKQITLKETPFQVAIAFSVYCFGSTPNDVGLSITRASQIKKQNSLTIALTGFLVGLYNSISGFPLAWRKKSQNEPLTQLLNQQVIQMFGLWSGVYEINSNTPPSTFTLAASGVIQRRTSLNLVSQDNN